MDKQRGRYLRQCTRTFAYVNRGTALLHDLTEQELFMGTGMFPSLSFKFSRAISHSPIHRTPESRAHSEYLAGRVQITAEFRSAQFSNATCLFRSVCYC